MQRSALKNVRTTFFTNLSALQDLLDDTEVAQPGLLDPKRRWQPFGRCLGRRLALEVAVDHRVPERAVVAGAEIAAVVTDPVTLEELPCALLIATTEQLQRVVRGVAGP